jgi:hypothetical protein
VAAAQSPTALKWWFAVEMRRMREAKGLAREDSAQGRAELDDGPYVDLILHRVRAAASTR